MTQNALQPSERKFKVLALSGGGYRGLYTAKILADVEDTISAPIATRFDLITGTSIGGILALALALEIPASKMVEIFVKHGGELFSKRFSLFGLLRAPYSPGPLKALLAKEDLFGNRLLGACKHPVLIPAINYTTGQAVMFKTAHHPDLRRDHLMSMVDVALATSAAPSYFPRHRCDNNQYVDGGLFANSPAALGLHEATEYFGQNMSDIHVLSVGSMSSRFTVDARRSPSGGAFDWGGWNPLNMPKRLFSLSISVQEVLSCHMLSHRLADRYLHIDDTLSDERSRAVALDKTDDAAREILLGVASQRSKHCISDPKFRAFISENSPSPQFFYGEHSSKATHA